MYGYDKQGANEPPCIAESAKGYPEDEVEETLLALFSLGGPMVVDEDWINIDSGESTMFSDDSGPLPA